ncbi:MAG TPA: hypothetical protein VFG23_19240 [Polyangia bacterium]|nr:hypothetical protein [Polyangia bacterium]
MPTYILLELADDGSVSATALTDPVTLTTPITVTDVPLADLLPVAKPVSASFSSGTSNVAATVSAVPPTL